MRDLLIFSLVLLYTTDIINGKTYLVKTKNSTAAHTNGKIGKIGKNGKNEKNGNDYSWTQNGDWPSINTGSIKLDGNGISLQNRDGGINLGRDGGINLGRDGGINLGRDGG